MTTRICGGCGAQAPKKSEPCAHCGSTEVIEHHAGNENGGSIQLEDSEILQKVEKGGIVGEAIARAIAPKNPGIRLALGIAGRFIGRRMARGVPLIAFGYAEEHRPQPQKKKRRTKKRAPKTTALTKRKTGKKTP